MASALHRTPWYFPAISSTTVTYLEKADGELQQEMHAIKQSPRFYNSPTYQPDSHRGDPFAAGYREELVKEKSPYFTHKFTLISAAHHYKKYPDIRKQLQIDADTIIMIDSGGYQLMTGVVKEKNYNNKIALEWSEKNGNIFPILDRPAKDPKNFEDAKRLTIEAARYYHDHRSAPGKLILNVLSAVDEPAMEAWYKDVAPFKFDGWAHGVYKNNLKSFMMGFLFLYNKGEYNRPRTCIHHTFGVTSTRSFIYMSYAQRLFNEMGVDVQITQDSSSFQRSMAFGAYTLFESPTSASKMLLSNTYSYEGLHDKSRLPCDCPVCSTVDDVRVYMSSPKGYYLLGALHNLYKTIQHKSVIDRLVNFGCDDVLFSCLDAKMVNNLKTLKRAFADPKNGIEIINHDFIDNGVELDQQTSLDDFF